MLIRFASRGFNVRLISLAAAGSISGATGPALQAHGPTSVAFNRDVRPILAENCYACHGFDPKHREGGLRLDTFAGATGDRDGSRGIVPGNVSESDIWARITSDDPDVRMPPPDSNKSPLSHEQRAILKSWIEQGANYEAHWAFIPPSRDQWQQETDAARSRNRSPIDDLICQRLAIEGLTPSPQAELPTLIRRVSLDLVGLPPTPTEVQQFVTASNTDPAGAYKTLVDRLLSSPHYGERWGRWWLDQARYADSNGYSVDAPRQIWKYRDWVIDALNSDMPFDRFTIEQLAGDLLPAATPEQKIATGFHRNTQINQEGGIDKEQFRVDSVFDRVATTGSVWLGLTIGCAQCHDHKFDPLEQREYYRLFAFLNNQDEPNLKVYDDDVDVGTLAAERKTLEVQLKAYVADHAADLAAWESEQTPAIRRSLPKPLLKTLDVPAEKRNLTQLRSLFAAEIGADGPFRDLNDRYNKIDAILNAGTTTLVMQERAEPRTSFVLIKGDFTRPADEVQPGTPAVLHPFQPEHERPNRLDLAKWLMSPQNPLTARVIMNRVWQQYFGRGLVETESDFGLQGTSPSHPELLDWLAIEFQHRGWSLKQMHRQIVLSQTYRQSSLARDDLSRQDPHNYLLGRQQRLRLDAEIVRDVALSASGLLCEKTGGPPVFPPIPDGVLSLGQVKRVWATSQGDDRYRRGIYTFVYRATPPPSLNVFDAPDGFSTCTRRVRSNTPLQALTLMNDAGFYEFATALQKIIEQQGLETAFQRCTSRPPTAGELAVLRRLDPLNAARVLLNLDETVTRE
ncbi:MAG: PSD1 and planctomycete cytochrome C domain-containing protein [Planctomycetaceae bacterium]